MRAHGVVIGLCLAAWSGVPAGAQNPPPAVPRPFPNAGAPARPAEPPATQPAPAAPQPAAPAPSTPAAAPAVSGSPAARLAPDQVPPGAPVYPTAEFIEAYDAGAGQRFYLYGTNIPYADIVAYYRNLLKNGGRELFRLPPTQQFDLGRFDSDTMAFPPSVVVKDYTWNGSQGYLAVSGTTGRRFKTVIQIVPPAPATR